MLSNHDVGYSRKTLLPRARCSFTVEESEHTLLWSPPRDTLCVLRLRPQACSQSKVQLYCGGE